MNIIVWIIINYLHKMYTKLNNLHFHFKKKFNRIERFRSEMLLSINILYIMDVLGIMFKLKM